MTLSGNGFVDEHYKRYLSRMEVARSIVKLGYSMDRRDVQPVLAEPLMVPAHKPLACSGSQPGGLRHRQDRNPEGYVTVFARVCR